MPKRPAEHVLEDRSHRALEAALSAGWVVRDPSHDYGIDTDVEIVEDAATTGLTFKVSSRVRPRRGAAPPSGSGSSTCAVRCRSTCRSGSSCTPRPPAQCTQVGQRRRAGAPALGPSGPKSVTVSFGAKHLLTAGPTSSLVGQVLLLQNIARGRFPTPVPLDVRVAGPVA